MADRGIRKEILDAFGDIERVLQMDDVKLAEWLLFNGGRCLGWASALGHKIEICTIHKPTKETR